MIYGTPPIVTNGLVLHLDAANSKSYISGSTVWNDLSGNNNSGSLINGPTFSSGNGGAIVFDGGNDYVLTPTGSTPTLDITSQITLETWLTTSTLANISHGAGIISKGLSSDGNSAVYESLISQVSGVNYPFFRMRIGSTSPFYSPTAIPINLNQIYHFVSTYNGNIMRIYINGVESGTGNSISGNIQTVNEPVAIGVRYKQRGDALSTLSGRIYVSRIYNRALSQTEILQNYNALKSRFNLT